MPSTPESIIIRRRNNLRSAVRTTIISRIWRRRSPRRERSLHAKTLLRRQRVLFRLRPRSVSNRHLPWHGVICENEQHASICLRVLFHHEDHRSLTCFFVLQETFFYTESPTVNPNSTNHQSNPSLVQPAVRSMPVAVDPSIALAPSPAPVIVTRTLSTSNVRNASSTIVQTTSTALANGSTPLLNPLPHLYPRSSHRNSSSPAIGIVPSYHPITTELWELLTCYRVFLNISSLLSI